MNSPPGLLAAFPAWPSMPPIPKWPPAWMAGGNQSGSPSICLSKLAKSGWSMTFWTSTGLASLCKIAGYIVSGKSSCLDACAYCSLTRHEVTAQARCSVSLANVDVEVGDCEGAFLHTATARTTPAVEHVCHLFGKVRRKVKVVSVTTETLRVGEEDCVVDGRGKVVVGLRVQGPVPVPSWS